MPTRWAKPRYIGYAAMAAGLRRYVLPMSGRSGSAEKPRKRTMFAEDLSPRISRACCVKERTAWTVFSASGTAASAFNGGTPSACGSVSVTRSSRPSPLSTSTNLWSLTGYTDTSTFGTSIRSSSSTNGALSLVEILPARLSTSRPDSSRVQKFPLAATWPFLNSTPMPMASRTPRPIRYLTGS